MLNLEIRRFAKRRTKTLGNLYINGIFFCNTLEDPDRSFPCKCNNTHLTYRGISSVCSHIINRGDSCSIQGKYDIKFRFVPELKKSLLVLLGEPHHQYIYINGLKSIEKIGVFTQIKIGFYDEDNDEFKMDYRIYKKLRYKISGYLSKKEKVELKINYNDA